MHAMSKARGLDRVNARAATGSPHRDEDETQLIRDEAALLPPVSGYVALPVCTTPSRANPQDPVAAGDVSPLHAILPGGLAVI